jgi:hypothetical protein
MSALGEALYTFPDSLHCRTRHANELVRQQLVESNAQLTLTSADLAATKLSLVSLQRKFALCGPSSGEYFFSALPRRAVFVLSAYCGPAGCSSLALSSRALHPKFSPAASERHRRSDGGFSDTVSVSSVVETPAARRRNWMGATPTRAQAPLSTGAVAGTTPHVSSSPYGTPSDLVSQPDKSAIASSNSDSRVSDGRSRRSGGGGMSALFRLGGVKTTSSTDKGKAPSLAPSTDVLPRGMALDYEAASKLLNRLQSASAQVTTQTQIIQDLSEKLRTADVVKEFLSKAVVEKEDALKAAISARDALIAQAGIDREVLSFLDDKSTELERKIREEEERRSIEREQAVLASSEAQQKLTLMQLQLGTSSALMSTTCYERDDACQQLLQMRLHLRKLEDQISSSNNVETSNASSPTLQHGIADTSSLIVEDASSQRISVLEGLLEASNTEIRDLREALHLAKLEGEKASVEYKAVNSRAILLEEQLAAATLSLAGSDLAGPFEPSPRDGSSRPLLLLAPSPLRKLDNSEGHTEADRVQELIVERERSEAKWKAERRTLAMEIRRLRAELDLFVCQVAPITSGDTKQSATTEV